MNEWGLNESHLYEFKKVHRYRGQIRSASLPKKRNQAGQVTILAKE